MKGTVYAGTQSFFAKTKGGLASLHAAIGDPKLLAFFQQKFLACAWYDVLPAVPLIHAEARALGLAPKRYLKLRTAHQAEQDLVGVYRLLLKIASPESVALRLPKVFTQVFDFGRATADAVGSGHVIGGIHDFPAVLFEWFSISMEAYALAALRIAGARNLTATTRQIPSTEKAPSVDLASLELDVRWSA